MFCLNCGAKIEEGAMFCQNCGNKADVSKTETQPAHIQPASFEELLYYSEEWTRAKHFAFFSVPRLDILVTKDNFCLIQFPKNHGGTLGLILGLLIFNIVGAIIGIAIGNSSDRKKRQKHRATWLMDNKLISTNYRDYAFVRMSKDKLRNHLSFEKDKLVKITEGEKIVKFKKGKKEFTNFHNFIDSYVL